jgi:hypothetical protein
VRAHSLIGSTAKLNTSQPTFSSEGPLEAVEYVHVRDTFDDSSVCM